MWCVPVSCSRKTQDRLPWGEWVIQKVVAKKLLGTIWNIYGQIMVTQVIPILISNTVTLCDLVNPNLVIMWVGILKLVLGRTGYRMNKTYVHSGDSGGNQPGEQLEQREGRTEAEMQMGARMEKPGQGGDICSVHTWRTTAGRTRSSQHRQSANGVRSKQRKQ